jgi:hypothetical protein
MVGQIRDGLQSYSTFADIKNDATVVLPDFCAGKQNSLTQMGAPLEYREVPA